MINVKYMPNFPGPKIIKMGKRFFVGFFLESFRVLCLSLRNEVAYSIEIIHGDLSAYAPARSLPMSLSLSLSH